MSAPPQYIDQAAELEGLCARLQAADWVALDTEFLREKTYFPKLCLLQLATPDWISCVDPLAIADLGPVLDALYRPTLLKVMHACSQDLEIFHHLRGELPGPVFDTQIAAPLLGYAEQIGYANLVRERLGVELEKTQTRTDWSRRPLRAEQLDYAADDVRFLAEIYPPMRDELNARGRLDWLADDFADLLQPERYSRPAEEAWQRIRGWDRLDPRALAAAQALAEWRETTARSGDRPRNALLRDEQLIDIARLRPRQSQDLNEIRNLPEPVIRRYGEAIIKVIEASAGKTPKPHPQPKSAPPSPQQEALADALTAVIRIAGLRHQINPASIASRKDVLRLIGGEDSALVHGWRRQLVGRDLQGLLQGDTALCVIGGELAIRANPTAQTTSATP